MAKELREKLDQAIKDADEKAAANAARVEASAEKLSEEHERYAQELRERIDQAVKNADEKAAALASELEQAKKDAQRTEENHAASAAASAQCHASVASACL